MAQENANVVHAAIAISNDFGPGVAPNAHVVAVRAATGIDLASVKRRTDLAFAPVVYEFDLVEAIADEDLILLVGIGPIKPNTTGTPAGQPSPSTLPPNVQRAVGDTTQRRFWILCLSTDANCYVQFTRIAPLDEPKILFPAP
jgi:hypothetical protein